MKDIERVMRLLGSYNHDPEHAALYQALAGVIADAERYRTARCMTPHQWSAAWELNVATGKPFDEIIDNMRPFVGGR